MNNPLGLYVHVPFCASKCAYCDFYSYRSDASARAEYVAAADRMAEKMAVLAGDRTTDTVYFGGGTPSALEPELFARLAASVRRFRVADDAEFTAEANPAPIPEELFRVWCASGVNRVSIGLQSAVTAELRAVGRRHTREDAAAAVRRVREAGIDNVTLDLMLGLPGQTDATAAESLEFALSLDPQHLSVYCLKLEENTPLARQVAAGRIRVADDDEMAERYLAVCDRLAAEGYEHYEISNFARPGCRSRHNLRYWRRQEYLGIGPAAHSFFEGRRRWFPADTAEFVRLASGPDVGWTSDDPSDAGEEYLILSLRLSDGWDPAEQTRLSGSGKAAAAETYLQTLVAPGYVRRTANGFALTDRGMLVSNTILSDLLLRMDG